MPIGGTNVATRTITGSGTYRTDAFASGHFDSGTGLWVTDGTNQSEVGADFLTYFSQVSSYGTGGPLLRLILSTRARLNPTTGDVETWTDGKIQQLTNLLGFGIVQDVGSCMEVGTGSWVFSLDTAIDISFVTLSGSSESGVRPVRMSILEHARVGGSFSAAMTLPDGTVLSIGGTIASPVPLYDIFSGSGDTRNVTASDYTVHGSANAIVGSSESCEAYFYGALLDYTIGYPAAYDSSNLHIDFADGAKVTVDPGVSNSGSVGAEFTYRHPMTFNVKAGVWQVDQPYGETFHGRMFGTPGFLKSFDIDDAGVSTGLDNTLLLATHYPASPWPGKGSLINKVYEVADGAQASFQLDPNDFTAYGDQQDLALPIRLPKFDAATLQRWANYLFDPCDNATGWVNGTLIGGYIQIDSASNGGIGQKTYSTAIVTEAWRYLDLRIRPNSSSDQPFTVEIWSGASGPKYRYEATTGASGSFSTQRIDLLGPDNQVSGVDAADSRWPLNSAQTPAPGLPGVEGNQWGLNRFKVIKLHFPASSGTYDVDYMSLEQAEDSKMSFLSSQALTKAANSPPIFYINRGLVGESDGRRSFEYWVFSQSGNVYSSLANAKTQFDSIPGWTFAILAASTKWYYDSILSALGGGGLIYDGSEDSWIHKAVPTSPTTPLTIEAQAKASIIAPAPNIGTLISQDTLSADDTEILLWKILRAQVSGVVMDSSQLPVDGATIDVIEQASGDAAGIGTTDTEGKYDTTDPYPKTTPIQVISVSGAGNDAKLAALLYNRQLRRVSFGIAPSESAPWLLQDREGRVHLATIQGGDVKYRRSDYSTPAPWAIENIVTTVGDAVFAAMSVDPSIFRIWLLVTELSGGSYSVSSCYSDDDGKTFSDLVLVMADALHGVPFSDSYGGVGFCWFEYDAGTSGPGSQWAQYQGPGDTAFGPAFQFVDQDGNPVAVADQGWSNVVQAVDDPGRLTWAPIIDGETTASFWQSFDNAQTWARVI